MSWDTLLGIITNGWTWTIISAGLGLFIEERFRKVIHAGKDILVKYGQSVDPKSPGGKKLTDKEREALVKEIVEFIQSLAIFLPKKFK